MTTTTRDEQTRVTDVLSALDPTDTMDIGAGERPGRRRRWLLPAVVLLIFVGLGAAGLATLAGAFGGGQDGRVMTHIVGKSDLLITITEDGNVESAANKDIKCEVAGGSTILSIIEDGKLVEEGEELARLDSSQLEDQINQQKITFEKANAAYIQADKDYNVAEISVDEYKEGTFRQELQTMEAQITIALENLRSAENTLQHTQRMFRKGYVSPLQRETQEFAVQRAKLELAAAETAKEVLEKFTKPKMLEDLQAKLAIAAAKKKSEKAAFDLEKARLERFQAQKEKCVILAPQDGMVVYANNMGGHRHGSEAPQIEEGAMVREQQTMFRLPDLTQMQVKVTVHESKVDQLSEGMRVRIQIQDEQYQGAVDSIANQPEPGGWWSASVKEYGTIVKVDGQQEGVKPGMTAEVEILVAHLKNVVTLPVAAVIEQQGKFYCWVRKGKKFERRPLKLGMSNDEFVEVKDGVAPKEVVIMNPRTVVPAARDETRKEEEDSVEKKFGSAPRGPAEGPGRSGPGAGRPAIRPGQDRTSQPGGDAPGRGGRGPGSGGGMMGMDADGDGKISRDEARGPMGDRFDEIDGNGDGFLDAAEISALGSRMGQGGGRPGGGRPGGSRP